MATFTSIRSALKTILDGISEIQVVFDYHEENLTGFPAVTFDVAEEAGQFITNKENLRTITFQINIYQEVKVITENEAKRILDVVSDAIITAIESDFNLSGTVDYCLPLAGPRGRFETPDGSSVFIQQLSIQCNYMTQVIST